MHLNFSSASSLYILLSKFVSTLLPAILAGDELASPDDFPSNRLDGGGVASAFNAVGALEITSSAGNFSGSGIALAPHWVLTAGHNVDLSGDGLAEAGNSYRFHLPDYGNFAVTTVHIPPSFTGFANPSINDDLALLYLASPLPLSLSYPGTILSATQAMEIALVGFGRSGFGSYGYTSSATLTDRRIGWNLIDTFEGNDDGGGFNEVFLYVFDAPSSPGSLGNDRESMIGPGDSGGPALGVTPDGCGLVGINTFTEGLGGRFGDTGGGILVEPYLPWIRETTGLFAIPEPSIPLLFFPAILILLGRRRPAWNHTP